MQTNFFIAPGTVLHDRYKVGEVISNTGYTISYEGLDKETNEKVEIKEYFPSSLAERMEDGLTVSHNGAEYSKGLASFMSESLLLSEVKDEPGIISQTDYYSCNNTSYSIFEFPDGETLASFLDREGTLPELYAAKLLTPVLQSLEEAHKKGLIHRNISPENIFLTKDGDVKLINFGIHEEIETNGYSAPERYTDEENQGPFTDIYSVGAVLYKMVTGRTPSDGVEREAVFTKSGRDVLMPAARINTGITDATNDAINTAMAIDPSTRILSALEFLRLINPEAEIFINEDTEAEGPEADNLEEAYEDANTEVDEPPVNKKAAAIPVMEPKTSRLYRESETEDNQKIAPVFLSDMEPKRRGVPKVIKFLLPAVLIVGLFAYGLHTIPKIFVKEPVKEAVAPEPVETEKKEETKKEEPKKEEPKIVEVPYVVGMDKEEAEETLKGLGLKYAIEEVDKASVNPGVVFEQSPQAGTEILTGDSLKLKIRSENVEIPLIIGKVLDDAKADLIAAGFSEEKILVNESDEAGPFHRSVLSVEPREGTKAPYDSVITLTVSAGSSSVEITDLAASSAMVPDEYGNTYYSYNMIDGLTYTCWTDGTSGDGIGEYIDFYFNPTRVTAIKVNNGYQKNSSTYGTELYYMNSRVKDVELEFSDGSIYSCTFSDLGYSQETITLPAPVEATWMRLTIRSVYQGTADWHDTCISEIEIVS